jgi:hypothetical protein
MMMQASVSRAYRASASRAPASFSPSMAVASSRPR